MMGLGGLSGIGGGQMPDFSQIREKMFKNADSNGDQGLSLDEFQKAGQNMPMGNGGDASKAKEMFSQIDTDGNGSASREEMRSFGERMSNQMRSQLLSFQGGGNTGAPNPNDLFKQTDGDSNGSVSREEFNRAGRNSPFGQRSESQQNEMFSRIDNDRSGDISQDEFKAFGDSMRQRLQGGGEGGAAPDLLMQALGAYGQGSQSSSQTNRNDLTSTLLDALTSSDKKEKRA